MTCAIRPQPTTPTLILPAIRTPFTECVGTFHGTYMNGLSVSTPRAANGRGQDSGRLRHPGFGGNERVLVLDGDGVRAAACRERTDKTVPPGLRLAPPTPAEFQGHPSGGFRQRPSGRPVAGGGSFANTP